MNPQLGYFYSFNTTNWSCFTCLLHRDQLITRCNLSNIFFSREERTGEFIFTWTRESSDRSRYLLRSAAGGKTPTRRRKYRCLRTQVCVIRLKMWKTLLNPFPSCSAPSVWGERLWGLSTLYLTVSHGRRERNSLCLKRCAHSRKWFSPPTPIAKHHLPCKESLIYFYCNSLHYVLSGKTLQKLYWRLVVSSI